MYNKYSAIEPSGFPSNVRITMQTSFSVTFEWNELACYEQNGPITGYQYRIYYCTLHYTIGTVGPNSTMHSIFYPNSSDPVCAISVAAMNGKGIGEHSPPITVPNGYLQCAGEKKALH